jgi:hypothetical protein
MVGFRRFTHTFCIYPVTGLHLLEPHNNCQDEAHNTVLPTVKPRFQTWLKAEISYSPLKPNFVKIHSGRCSSTCIYCHGFQTWPFAAELAVDLVGSSIWSKDWMMMCEVSASLSSTQTVQIQPLPRYLLPYFSRAIHRPGLKARPASAGQKWHIYYVPVFKSEILIALASDNM